MKILSIDVGIYNLAICILNVNEKIEIEDEPKQIELTLMDKMILNLK